MLQKTSWISFFTAVLMAVSITGCATRAQPSDQLEASREESVPEEEVEPEAPKRGDTSFAAITSHIDLALSGELMVTRPAEEEITTTAEHYYITGISDPDQPLLMNGEEVEHRGLYGSFGVYVELDDEEENVFTFTQGEESVTITITVEDEAEPYTTETLTGIWPPNDTAIRSGGEYTVRCTAPAGSEVTAELNGTTLELEQNVATELEGIPAVYSAAFTPEEAEGTENWGKITYTLEWGEETTSYPSEGDVYVVGSEYDLIVQAKDVSATTFLTASDDDGNYFTTLRQGAVMKVDEIGGSYYGLHFGAWVFKDAVQPLTGQVEYRNRVDSVEFVKRDNGEAWMLQGTAATPYLAEWLEESLRITLYDTTGITKFPLEDSVLFRDVIIEEDDGDTVLEFVYAAANPVGGYLVQYDSEVLGDGEWETTVLTFLPKTRQEEGETPLRGVTIALDPGHGGSDDGASGVPWNNGPKEKEINLQTAQAVEKYLRALGADVILLRGDDSHVDMNARLEQIQQTDVDLMVSLHCNSISYSVDGTRPNGVEIYYYEEHSEEFADAILARMLEKTGRSDREVRHSHYKITLNSNAPSVMVEMGFLTNPVEYDNLIDPQQIYLTAEAIAEGILDFLA